MTAPARITKADMKRAAAVAREQAHASGLPARVIFRLESGEIEMIVGDQAAKGAAPVNEWDDE